MEKNKMKSIACALFVIFVAACPLSPKPDDSPGSKAIDCLVPAVQKNGPAIIPAVNTCLRLTSGDAKVSECLLGLVGPAAGVTESVLACVVHRAAQERAAAFAANPADHVSAQMKENAEAFVRSQGYTFRSN